MTTSLFIVTYWRDLDWLPYLLRSIGRYVTGFSEIVILIPDRDLHLLAKFGLTKETIRTFSEDGFASGFMAHQYAKCCADEYCTGDTICFIDSDCVFIAPTTPQSFLTPDNKCINLFSYFRPDDEIGWWPSPWKHCTERFLGQLVEVETMRRHCNIYPRSLFKAFRDHVHKANGVDLKSMIQPIPRTAPAPESFSEFCALGAYGYYHQRDDFCWIEGEKNTVATPIYQFWSHHRAHHPEMQRQLGNFGLLS